MQFVDMENRDGVRFSWNVLPTNRVSAQRLAVPIGCLYTPLKPLQGLGTVNYKPVLCPNAQCGAILNPYWYVAALISFSASISLLLQSNISRIVNIVLVFRDQILMI